jgi:isopentenyldiphosphate isomerase
VKAGEEDLTYLFTVKGFYENPQRAFYDHELSDVYLLETGLDADAMKFGRDEVEEIRYMQVDDLRKDLLARPGLYVPHHETYGKLFGYFG